MLWLQLSPQARTCCTGDFGDRGKLVMKLAELLRPQHGPDEHLRSFLADEIPGDGRFSSIFMSAVPAVALVDAAALSAIICVKVLKEREGRNQWRGLKASLARRDF